MPAIQRDPPNPFSSGLILLPQGLCLLTTIHGRSMEPLIHDGQQVLIALRPRDRQQIPPQASAARPQDRSLPSLPPTGSIIALRSADGRLVLHRLLLVHPHGPIITQGDGLPYRDAPWAPEQLLGPLLAVRRGNIWCRPRPAVARAAALLAPLRPGRLRRTLLRALHPLAWARDHTISIPPSPASHQALPRSIMIPDRFEVQELGTELAIYDRETGAVHILNTLAAEIWRRTLQGKAVNEIISELHSDFPDVTLDQLQRDVLTTVSTLANAGLLPQHPRPNPNATEQHPNAYE